MKKVLDKLSNGMMLVACFSLAACVLVNAYEIFMRFFLAKSLYWIQDFTLLTMLWFIFPGMVKIAYNGNDIKVDIFMSFFSPALQKKINVLVDILTALFCLCLLAFSINMFVLRIGQVKTMSNIPLNLYTAAIIISMLFMSLVYICKLQKHLADKENT